MVFYIRLLGAKLGHNDYYPKLNFLRGIYTLLHLKCIRLVSVRIEVTSHLKCIIRLVSMHSSVPCTVLT